MRLTQENWVGLLWALSLVMAVAAYGAIAYHWYIPSILAAVLGTVFGLSGFALRSLSRAQQQWANRDS